MTKHSIQSMLAGLALLGFLSVALFWSVGMHAGGSHNCISAAIQNDVCPNATTPEATVFHAGTLQSLITNVLSTWSHFGSLMTMVFVILIGIAGLVKLLSPGLFYRRDAIRMASPPEEYQHWLSLFEHSPSVLPGRV